MTENAIVCTGTLVEHLVGPVECTDDACTAAPEEHWLVVGCVEIACRCTRPLEETTRVR